VTTLLPSGAALRSRGALDDDVDLARDRVLVTRAQEGDRAAFDDLYLRYYRRLYRFCLRRLHDAHEAEDVAQEAFARAWRALPAFGGDRRFYPWLSVIASHLCTDVLRRRNRSTPVAEFHQGNVASTEDGGEDRVVAAVDCELVSRAFSRLSERHQRILKLREGSGWSYQRIADHEGVGITAVETLLWRARQALKREFASLAGNEGRGAAIAGGLFSLATLRRLLSAPVHAARRMAHVGPGAIAVGSVAAAAAAVVAATVGAPVPAPAATAAPATPLAAPAGHGVPRSDIPNRLDVGTAVAGTAAPLPPPGARAPGAPGLPSLPSLPGLSGAVGAPLGAVGSGIGQTLGAVGQAVNGATAGLAQDLAGLSKSTGLAPISNALSPLLGGLSSTAANATTSLSTTVGALAQAPGSALGSLGSLGPLGATTTTQAGH
jgi:RNA polymerase sigma-70 factor (ECF subfamily)